MGTSLALLSSKMVLAEGTAGATATAAVGSASMLTSFLQVAPAVACQAVFFAPLEAMKTIKANGTTGEFPVLPYAAMCLNGVLWMTYGNLIGEMTVLLPNVSALILGSYYVYTYNQYKPANFNMTPYFGAIAGGTAAILAVANGLEASLATNVLGVCGNAVAIVMFTGPLMAMKTVIDQKSTASLPFAMTCATFLNCSLWVSYGVMIDDPYIWFCNGLGLMSSFVQFGLFAKYGFPKNTKDVGSTKAEV